MMIRNSEIKDIALGHLRGNWGGPILVTFVFAVLSTATRSLILSIFLGGPIALGLTLAYLAFVRGEKTDMLSRMFCGFNDYGRALGLSFMVKLYIFLWTLLLIIPGIVKKYSYAMTFYISEDHKDYTVDQCIEASRTMMYGYKWKLFLLHLGFIGWALLALIFTFGIGFLWLAPYIRTSEAVFYEELKKVQSEKNIGENVG